MKTSRLLLVAACLLAFTTSIQSQIGCGDDIVLNLQRSANPHYDEVVKQINLGVKQYINDHYTGTPAGALNKTATANYVIPVVFHIVYPNGQAYGTGANIPYTQIQSQINALNAAYSRSYPAYNGQTHPAYAQNTNIQFCLAKIAMPSSVSFYSGPNGTEYGVMRYADNTLTNHQMSAAGATSLVNLTHPTAAHFPFNNYLNVWVVSSIASGSPGTVMGYAPRPLMGSYPLDGVVMRSDVIGDNSTGATFALGYGLTMGKVLVHETGHYFNLYHIFEGGCAGANAAGAPTDACDLNGDMICDIEPCTTQNINCNQPIPNTCTANYATGTTSSDMIESYMSYADDDCMNTFTSDQANRMWATLNTLRQNLWQTANLSATGIIGTGSCINPFLMTSIRKSTNNICMGSGIQLSNPTNGNTAVSWNWALPGSTTPSASGSSVTATYANAGTFWARLTVSEGSITAKDSILIQVANCSLDTSLLDRAHWYFGNWCGINFNTTPASADNAALTYSTMNQGWESTISMSDKKGRLLFYSNCMNFWDDTHHAVNSFTPCLNLANNNASSSTPGIVTIPYPGDSSKYITFSSPHTGQIYDSIYYVVYDIYTKVLTGIRGLRHPALPPAYSEPLTVVPHCNGRDYWVICRPKYDIANANRAYSVLITPAGPGTIGKVVTSNNIAIGVSGQLKSNSKGTRLIQADYGGMPIAYLYDFNPSTGVMKNETGVNGLVSNLIGTGAVVSSNDTLAYVLSQDNNGHMVLHGVNLFTLQTHTLSVPANSQGIQMERGPDNNIYVAQTDYYNTTVGRINSPNSWTGAAFAPGVISYTTYPQNPFGGLPNYMDAKKGPEIAIDYQYAYVSCNTLHFTVDSCWQVYTASWTFGDGGTATGLSVNHTYATTGSFTAKLVLSVGSYSLPAVIKNINVMPAAAVISGPSVICKGSTYVNTYNTNNIPGATYTWSANNAVISGPNYLSSVNVSSSGLGSTTITVHVNDGGCNSTGNKAVIIDTIPLVTLSGLPPKACQGNVFAMTGTPAGGTYSGAGVSGNVFNATAAGGGTHQVNYTYTNTNGCTGSATATIVVNGCVGIDEASADAAFFSVYPNPNSGEFVIRSNRDMSVLITDELGQLLQTVPLSTGNDHNAIISGLSNGVYFINSGPYRQKVIVIR